VTPFIKVEKQGSQKPCFSCFQNSRLVKIFAGDDFADLLINIPCASFLKDQTK
jgi:hypothetical protein